MAKKNQKNKPAEMTSEIQEKSTKKQYWQTKVYIRGIGVVQGEVNPEHLKAFKALVSKDTDIKKWVGETDPIAEAKLEKQKIAKARREGKIIE